jgi:hypothetical protein
MFDTVLNSHTTAAMETTAGKVTASPVKKLERHRVNIVFLTQPF